MILSGERALLYFYNIALMFISKHLYLDSLRYHFYQYVNERCSKFSVFGVCFAPSSNFNFENTLKESLSQNLKK
jgi:hypothetical protein